VGREAIEAAAFPLVLGTTTPEMGNLGMAGTPQPVGADDATVEIAMDMEFEDMEFENFDLEAF
jgi:hypothetical protein